MRRSLVLPAAVLLAATAMVAPSSAGVVPDEDSMVIDPSEGPPGTEIAVSGEGCATKGEVEVDVVLLDTEGVQQDSTTVTPSGDGFGGEWDATVTVPADTTDFGEWTVDAICWISCPENEAVPAGDPAIVDYTDLPFTVTEPAVAPEEPEVPEPPAAAPIAAAPDVTG
jgi:hypothetical protein